MTNQTLKALQDRIDAGSPFPVGTIVGGGRLFRGLPDELSLVAGKTLSTGGQAFDVTWAGLSLPVLVLKPNLAPSSTEVITTHVASVPPRRIDIDDATVFYYFADVVMQPMTLQASQDDRLGYCFSNNVSLDTFPFTKVMKYAMVQVMSGGKPLLAGILSLRGNATLCVTIRGEDLVIYAFRRTTDHTTSLKLEEIIESATQVWVYSTADRVWLPRTKGEV